jgi:hypothetical protein
MSSGKDSAGSCLPSDYAYQTEAYLRYVVIISTRHLNIGHACESLRGVCFCQKSYLVKQKARFASSVILKIVVVRLISHKQLYVMIRRKIVTIECDTKLQSSSVLYPFDDAVELR